MHSFLALAVALLSTTALAAPAPVAEAAPAPAGGPQSPPPQASVAITLQGATPEDQTTVYIPTTSTFTPTYFGSSISHAITNGGPCTLFGVDGLVLHIGAASTVDVGPPQTIVGALCAPQHY